MADFNCGLSYRDQGKKVSQRRCLGVKGTDLDFDEIVWYVER